MIRLKIVDVHGRETSLGVQAIVAIDDKPYGTANDPALKDRIVILESQVADLIAFRDAIIEATPKDKPS